MNTTIQAVKAHYQFEITTQGAAHTVTYRQAKPPIRLLGSLLLFCGLVTLLLAMILKLGVSTGLTYWLVMAVGTYAFLYFSRTGGAFTITPTHYIIGDKSYERAHINKVFWGNRHLDYDTKAIWSRDSRQGNDHFRRMRRLYGTRDYHVDFRYGEHSVILASGLTGAAAEVLLNKITQL